MRFLTVSQLLVIALVPMTLELAETFGALDTPLWRMVHSIGTIILVVALVVVILQRLRLLPAVRE